MTWDDVSKAWDDVWASIDSQWRSLYEQAVKAWGAEIQKDPEAFAPKVEAWTIELNQCRANLDRIKAALPKPGVTPQDVADRKAYLALEARYQELAAGFYADARPVEGNPARPVVGVIPVLLVAGLAVGVGGTAWAVAAYEYAASLREQTGLAAAELEARIQASQAGRALPPSTLPSPTPSAPEPMSQKTKAYVALGVLTLAAGAFTLPLFLKR